MQENGGQERAEVFTIINSGCNTAGGGRRVQPATILSTTPIDRTRVLDCTDPRAKLPARGVWCWGEGLGQQEQDSQTDRPDGVPAPQLLSLGHCPNSEGHRPS